MAGASSDAGKSVLTARICRWLHRQGLSGAPFKAMNMSNNSAVTSDGGEIGRAQGGRPQAAACGLAPQTAMNPVLLKPGGARRSHLVLRGRPLTDVSVRNYRGLHPQLRAATLDWRTGSSPGRARSRAWGCLPVRVHFDTDKLVGRTTGTAYGEPVTTGYEIHHGVAALTVPGAAQPFLDGYRLGAVWGTTWRGAWKRDGFRRAFLRDVADLAGRDFAPAPDVELAAVRAAVRSTWTRSGTWSPITWTSR